jgi:hypothetical protein
VVSVAVPPLAMLVLAALIFWQLDFLEEEGWSPVRRTPVLWPSLLALGPQGYVATVAFILLGAAVLALALPLLRSPTPTDRWAGTFLGVVSTGLVLAAVPTDLPGSGGYSWHAAVHDVASPLIPLGAIAAAVALAAAPLPSVARSASRLLLPIMALSYAATVLDPIAQLVRYLAFFSMLVWFEIVAWHWTAVRAPWCRTSPPADRQ